MGQGGVTSKQGVGQQKKTIKININDNTNNNNENK